MLHLRHGIGTMPTAVSTNSALHLRHGQVTNSRQDLTENRAMLKSAKLG